VLRRTQLAQLRKLGEARGVGLDAEQAHPRSPAPHRARSAPTGPGTAAPPRPPGQHGPIRRRRPACAGSPAGSRTRQSPP
jgi:hypothetical protein